MGNTIPDLFFALLALALLGFGGSVYFSVVRKLSACALCYYERVLFASIALVLIPALGQPLLVPLTAQCAMPLCFTGFWILLFHSSQVWQRKMECPLGIGAVGSIPTQALLLMAAVTSLCVYVASLSFLELTLDAILGGVVMGFSLKAVALPPATALPSDSRKARKNVTTCQRLAPIAR